MINTVSFTKEHTSITKGILILMMLMHHVFTPSLTKHFSVNITMNDQTLFLYVCTFFGLCISGFAFITAFGMTHSFNKLSAFTPNNYFKLICKRLISLTATIFIIYALAILYKRFVIVESIRELYDRGDGFSIIYMLIDLFGMATYFNTPTLNITWWYLSYAILLIVAIPFIYMAYKKFRYLLLPAGCLLSLIIPGSTTMFFILLPSVLFGVAFAYERWFEKIHDSTSNIYIKLLRISVEVIGLIISYHLYRAVDLTYSYIFAFLIPLLVFEFIYHIPILNTILKYIGKHATNIFLTHTFIYYYFYTDFIYSFKKDWLIIIILTVICLLVSISIEALKKITGYNLLIYKIQSYFKTK